MAVVISTLVKPEPFYMTGRLLHTNLCMSGLHFLRGVQRSAQLPMCCLQLCFFDCQRSAQHIQLLLQPLHVFRLALQG
jgi:hypothetical protein